MAERIHINVARARHGNRKMLYLKEQYERTHPDEAPEIHPERIAKWALKEKLWQRELMDDEEVLRRLIKAALRDDYMIDPQGREVRANLPFMEEVETTQGPRRRSVWYPMYYMPPEKARSSFQLRRRGALHDVLQIRFDFESYNDNNMFSATLEAPDFDFNRDIEEMSEPTDYQEEPPPEEDEEADGI